MASLVDRVNKSLVRKDGKLVEQVTPTPTSQLAGQAGLTAPPTTPAGVAALGGTPQQQAMAGSVAQKTSALRQSLDSTTSLQEAEADKRYRSAATADEQQRMGKQKRLGEVFGNTQQKVQDLIGTEMNKQQVAAVPTFNTSGALTASHESNQLKVDEALANIVSGTNAQANVLKVMELTGLTQEQVAAAAQDAASKQLNTGAGKAAAGAVADSSAVNVSTLLPSLGTNRDELSTLLGLSPEQIDTMSLADLDEAVKATASQGPGLSVAETDAASQSGLLGAAERAAMREASREQSTTGAAASEAQLADLGHALESSEVVQFGGKQYTVEQLLADDSISKIVSDYLTNPDSDTSKQLASDPNAAGLLAFVGRYKQALTDAATGVQAATSESSRIQAENRALSNVSGVNLPDTVMKALYGDKWGTPQAAQLAPTGIVQALQDMPPEDMAAIKPQLMEMMGTAQEDPSLAADIKDLSSSELKGLFTPRAGGKTPWQDLQDTRVRKRELESAKDNIDSLLSLYFGAPTDLAKVRQASSEDVKAQKLGAPHSPVLQSLGIDASGRETMGTGPEFLNNLYETILNSLNTRDQPDEILQGPWKPAALPTLTSQQKAAYTGQQENLRKYAEKVRALESYLNGPSGVKDPKERAAVLERQKATLRSELGIK